MLVARALQAMKCSCIQFISLSTLIILLQQSVFGQETTVSTEGPVPTISNLIREVKFNTEEQSILSMRGVVDYSYKWRKVVRRTKDNGKTEVKSETYEVYLPRYWGKKMKGEKVLLEKNGKFVPQEKVEKKRLKARKKMEKKNRSSGFFAWTQGPPEWGHFATWKRGMWGARAVGFDAQKVLRYCDLHTRQRENVAGREMIAINFSGCTNFFYNQFTRVTPELEGKIWIDANDRVFARIAVWPKDMKIDNQSGDSLFKNAPMVFGSTRVAEGFWFWNYGRINCQLIPDICYPMEVDYSIEVFDYVSLK
jgi:sulfur carrier protein ThiS